MSACCLLLQELDTGYRKIWDFGRNWDPDAYASPRGLAEIRRDLINQRNFKAQLDRMKTNITVGCLQVRCWLDVHPMRWPSQSRAASACAPGRTAWHAAGC